MRIPRIARFAGELDTAPAAPAVHGHKVWGVAAANATSATAGWTGGWSQTGRNRLCCPE